MKHNRIKRVLLFLITPCFLANAPAPRPDYDENYDGITVSNIELVKQEDYLYSYIATFKNEGDKFVEPRNDIYLENDEHRSYIDARYFQIIAPQTEVTISFDFYNYSNQEIEVIPENFFFRSLVTKDIEFTDFNVRDIGISHYEGDEHNNPCSYVSFTSEFTAKEDTYGYLVNVDYDDENRYYMIRYGSSGSGEHHLSFQCEYDFDISKMNIKSLTPLGYSHHYHSLSIFNWGYVFVGILAIGLAEIVIGGIVAICVVHHVKKKKRLKAQSK